MILYINFRWGVPLGTHVRHAFSTLTAALNICMKNANVQQWMKVAVINKCVQNSCDDAIFVVVVVFVLCRNCNTHRWQPNWFPNQAIAAIELFLFFVLSKFVDCLLHFVVNFYLYFNTKSVAMRVRQNRVVNITFERRVNICFFHINFILCFFAQLKENVVAPPTHHCFVCVCIVQWYSFSSECNENDDRPIGYAFSFFVCVMHCRLKIAERQSTVVRMVCLWLCAKCAAFDCCDSHSPWKRWVLFVTNTLQFKLPWQIRFAIRMREQNRCEDTHRLNIALWCRPISMFAEWHTAHDCKQNDIFRWPFK